MEEEVLLGSEGILAELEEADKKIPGYYSE
jgi:hypothetical protein